MKICLECEGISDTEQELCSGCQGPLTETAAVHFPLRRGEAEAANPLLGTVIDGKYLVLSVLGKGGMGTVFRAIHQVSLVPIALKILNPRFSFRREYRNYFLAEARKAGRVTHEHAGRVLDVGEAEDGTVYIAMEEIHGVTLHECLHGPEPLSPVWVVEILIQICGGLAAAHRAEIVHRDLSPRNVMVEVRDGEPFVKILDFGIAKGLPQGAAESLDPQSMSGPAGFANPPYSSPEHLEGKDVDARADLYSLGVIAYEALTQQLPVETGTTDDMAAATVRGELGSLLPIAGTPPRLIRLIHQLLSQNPADRPDSAEEVLATLQAIRQPRSRVLRDVAVLVFFVSVVVLGFAYSRETKPWLQLRPTGQLLVSPSVDGQPPLQQLRPTQIESLRFEYRGFSAAALSAEVIRDNQSLWTGRLGGVDERGDLVLDQSKPRYKSFVSVLKDESRRGALVITFGIRGYKSLGVAHVQIDGSRPTPALRCPSSLSAKSRIEIESTDEVGSLAQLHLDVLRAGQDNVRVKVEHEPSGGYPSGGYLAGSLLKQFVKGIEPVTMTLKLTATDEAGNTAETKRHVEVDLRAPKVKEARAVFHSEKQQKALVTLRLDDYEPGLRVTLQRHGSSKLHRVDAPRLAGDAQLEFDLTETEGVGNPVFDIVLIDRFGNAQSTRREIVFHTREYQFKLAPGGASDDSPHPFTWWESAESESAESKEVSGLAWSGKTMRFNVECNRYYRPKEVRGEGFTATLIAHDWGKATIEILPGADTDMRISGALVFKLRQKAVNQTSDFIWPVAIRSQSLHLELPAMRRFHVAMVSKTGLFDEKHSADGKVALGLERWFGGDRKDDFKLLTGEVLWGTGGSETQPLGLTELHLLANGLNSVGLKLSDVFGRSVEVSVGNVLQTRSDSGVVHIGSFQYQPTVASLRAGSLTIEYQQPTEVVFETNYRFAAGKDKIELWINGKPHPVRVRRATELVCTISYRDIQAAVPKGAKQANLRLVTPAGEHVIEGVRVAWTRSSLVPVQLDAVLGGIRMVPVLGPAGPFADRADGAMRARGDFLRKKAIAVKSIPDCFLQRSELTRGQYAAIVETYFARDPADRPTARELLYEGDPYRDRNDGSFDKGAMRPQFAHGRSETLEDLHKIAAPDAVRGLSFFQAYAVARMLGVLVCDDVRAFRLPFGVEMELAALEHKAPGTFNGVAGGVSLGKVRSRDTVITGRKHAIHGLDFGVREWVMDLPWPSAVQGAAIVEQWMKNHRDHIAKAVEFAPDAVSLTGFRDTLLAVGVVRGTTLTTDGEFEKLSSDEPVPKRIRGVMRTCHLHRGGLEIEKRVLRNVGLRLAGGERFVAWVRSR